MARSIAVKICCIASVEEARWAAEAGAKAVGLVSEMPSGPGVLSEERIAEIVPTVPASVRTFLLTSKQDANSILAQQRRTGANVLQLCDAVAPSEIAQIRAELPEVQIVQVIHVLDSGSVSEAREAATFADALLLDSGNPNLEVKLLGGTGRRHDWSLSRRIVASVAVPVWLAGGLNAENVGAAIRQVQPYGLDLCSSVRTDGNLDRTKLRAFFAAVQAA